MCCNTSYSIYNLHMITTWRMITTWLHRLDVSFAFFCVRICAISVTSLLVLSHFIHCKNLWAAYNTPLQSLTSEKWKKEFCLWQCVYLIGAYWPLGHWISLALYCVTLFITVPIPEPVVWIADLFVKLDGRQYAVSKNKQKKQENRNTSFWRC